MPAGRRMEWQAPHAAGLGPRPVSGQSLLQGKSGVAGCRCRVARELRATWRRRQPTDGGGTIMTDRSKMNKEDGAGKKRPRIGKLELNKETVEYLTNEQAEAARGGAAEADRRYTGPGGLRLCP